MHEYFICKAGSLFQTCHAFHNLHVDPAIFFQIFELIFVNDFLRAYLQFHLHVLWVWQKGGIEKSFISAVVDFAPCVETTLLRRSFTVSREAATDEASPQKSNLLPPTVMRTQYSFVFQGSNVHDKAPIGKFLVCWDFAGVDKKYCTVAS